MQIGDGNLSMVKRRNQRMERREGGLMSKPKIKRRESITYGKWMWECAGNGSMGLGDSPAEAYDDWKLFEKSRGRMLWA